MSKNNYVLMDQWMDGGKAIHIASLLEYLWINLIDNKKKKNEQK